MIDEKWDFDEWVGGEIHGVNRSAAGRKRAGPPPLWNPNLDDGVIINFAPLWRVVPKRATDRSLVIAHGLENECCVEGSDGKWKPRPTPTRPTEDIVREHSSPAVKSALKNLLEAPVASGNPKRTRKGKNDA